MKRNGVIFTALAAMAALLSTSHAATTNTFKIGGGGARDMAWTDGVVTNTGVSPTEYSVSFGAPERYPELDNVLFTVTVSETNDVMFLRNVWLGGTNGHASRLDGDEAVRVKVAYSDPDSKLLELDVAGIGSMWNTLSHETIVFSDGTNSYSMTDTENEAIVDYDTTGLDQLTLANTGSWSLLVGVDDTLGGGTNFTESGLGAFVLEYVADVDEIPAYVPLNPANFAFVNGSEFDAKTLGDNATMTRSNSWGTAITIATVDIIGQDGSKASDGVDHKTNVYAPWGDYLGINDANVSGQEYGNFNLGEAWVVTFDIDVYLTEIDFGSQSGADKMTIKSSAFPDIVLADGESGDTHDLGNAFVPAGTNVTFECTGPTDPAGGLRIAYLEVQSVQDVNSYDAWIQDQDLIEQLNDAYGDDPDEDFMDNLSEYAFGGTALSADTDLYGPDYATSEDGGSNYLNYIYRRRMDRAVQGLSYAVGASTDLTGDPLTNATFESGSTAIDGTYESVTNQVSTDAADAQFMQLKVTAD